MKKLALFLLPIGALALLLAPPIAEAKDGRARVRHERRHSPRRRLGPPLAFRHNPRHLHSRHYRHHPHRYRPYRYGFRRYSYWAPFGFGFGWPHRHRADCRHADHHEHDEEPADREQETIFEYGAGWRLYGEGNTYDALRAFAQAASDDPEDSVAKVGVGLAAAETGDLARGVWSMRRAFRVDPGGVRYVPVDRRIAGRIRALLSAYRKDARQPANRIDHSFMLAALHYLLDEEGAASDEVRLAREYGDRSNSANNLEKLLQDRVNAKR